MSILVIIILIVVTALCISTILFTYRNDQQNKRNLIFSFIITLTGTFAGVLLAVALSDYQNERNEKNQLKAIIRQAYVETHTVTFEIGDAMGFISSLLEKDGIGHAARDENEMRVYKQKLKDGTSINANNTIRNLSNSEVVDKMLYCESLLSGIVST